jgi:hypothetical protein
VSFCTIYIYRYKIYAEGFAWSVSLKYILSCGSMALLIDPQYQDFFSRGLEPKVNYWPVSALGMCDSIRDAVDWGNANSSEAERVGDRGQRLMEELSMDNVYDYMLHLLTVYARRWSARGRCSASPTTSSAGFWRSLQRSRLWTSRACCRRSDSMWCRRRNPA